jgi:putative transposase
MPGQRRDAALGVIRDYQVSQRRACVLIGVDPKSAGDGHAGGMGQSRARRERPPDHAEIREEMREIAAMRRRFGYRRVGEASRVFRRLLLVRRSYHEQDDEQVFT